MVKLVGFLLLLDIIIQDTFCNTEVRVSLPHQAIVLSSPDFEIPTLHGPSKGLLHRKINEKICNPLVKSRDEILTMFEPNYEVNMDFVRIPRQTERAVARPSVVKITKLIRKALSLVKKVEGIDEHRRSSREKIKLNVKKETPGFPTLEENDDKEESQFADLKKFIQSQNTISNLIRSETASLKDLIKNNPSITQQEKHKDATRSMIEALIKLNSISSVLLNERDSTKTAMKKMPSQVKKIVQSEMEDLKKIIKSHNFLATQSLRQGKQLSSDLVKRDLSSTSEAVILKALSKLNSVASILLKDKQERDQQSDTALSAIPKLAQFIQAETSDIRNLVKDQSSNTETEALKKSVGLSLANDKLIIKAIVTLNDITQSLLRDVNFTTTTITSSLPKALAELIKSETSKIRKLIDSQNSALNNVVSESKNLARAEQVIKEAKQLKESLVKPPELPEVDQSVDDNDRQLLDLISSTLFPSKPLLVKKKEEDPEESRSKKLLAILTPLLTQNEALKTEKTIKSEQDILHDESQLILKTQLSGQRAIVQALTKLTNITRGLLEDKLSQKQRSFKNENNFNEPRNRDTDEDFDRPKNKGNGEDFDRPRNRGNDEDFDRPRNRGNNKDFDRPRNRGNDEDFDGPRNRGNDEDFDGPRNRGNDEEFNRSRDSNNFFTSSNRNNNVDRPRRKNKKDQQTNDEEPKSRLAPLETGTNYLFEEFVKLAIERQRWDQAQEITAIIRHSNNPNEEDEDDYEYERRKQPSRRKKGDRRKPSRPSDEEDYQNTDDEDDDEYEENRRKGFSKIKHSQKINRRRPTEYEYYDYDEKRERNGRPSKRKNQRPAKHSNRRLPTKEDFTDFEYEDIPQNEDYIVDEEIIQEFDSIDKKIRPQRPSRIKPSRQPVRNRSQQKQTAQRPKFVRKTDKNEHKGETNLLRTVKQSTPKPTEISQSQEPNSVNENQDRTNRPIDSLSESVRSKNLENEIKPKDITIKTSSTKPRRTFSSSQKRKTARRPQVLKKNEAPEISERDDEKLRKNLLKKLLEKRPKVLQTNSTKTNVIKNAALENLLKISKSKTNSENSKKGTLTISAQESPENKDSKSKVILPKKRKVILRKKKVNPNQKKRRGNPPTDVPN